MIGVGDAGLKRFLQRVEITNTENTGNRWAAQSFFHQALAGRAFRAFHRDRGRLKAPLYLI